MKGREINQVKLLESSVFLAELILLSEGLKVGESTLFGGFYREVINSAGELNGNNIVAAKGDALVETMLKGDCQKTASWGRSNDAKSYQSHQKELVGEGNFSEALRMDVEDVISKFGDKYNTAVEKITSTVEKFQQDNTKEIGEAKKNIGDNKNNFNLANQLRNNLSGVSQPKSDVSEKRENLNEKIQASVVEGALRLGGVNRGLANQVRDTLVKDFQKLGEIKDKLEGKLNSESKENRNL